MIIQLDRIDFDHTPLTATTDALSIRVNATLTAGSWLPSTGSSKAAYALVPTHGQQLTILASFTSSPIAPLPGPTVRVRAVPVNGTTSVLGSVAATSILVPTNAGATTGPLSLPLTSVGIWSHGVGRYPVSWQWQVQVTAGAPWLNFDRSDHIIYVTVDLPGAPWGQASDSLHQPLWPWTDVLDWGCVWASGVRVASTGAAAATKAARRIEKGLNDLGSRPNVPLEYYGQTQYTPSDSGVGRFYLTNFLALLAEVPAPGLEGLNCTDCAAAVATFANALGCDLGLHRIERSDGGIGFDTNPMVKIGKSGPSKDFFGHHDIAISQGTIDEKDQVYDACLMVDHDTNPANSTHSQLRLARGEARGKFAAVPTTQLKYLQRLIAPGDLADCDGRNLPLPCLDACIDAQTPSAPLVKLWGKFREQVELMAGPAVSDHVHAANLEPLQVAGFYPYERVLSPVHLAVLRGLVERSVEYLYGATNVEDDRRLAISIGYSASSSKARDALGWLLTQSDRPPRPDHAERRLAGDALFTTDKAAVGFFMRSNVVARVRNLGREPVPLSTVLTAIDAVIQSPSVPEARRNFPGPA